MRLKNLVPLLILLAACSTPPAGTPSGIEAGQPAGGDTPSQPPATLPAPTPVILNSGPLVLTLISPLNDAVVGEPQINLIGNVSRDAMLTVNDGIYIMPAGDFSIPLILEEGPNALEIVASDTDGNEVDLILAVTYQP